MKNRCILILTSLFLCSGSNAVTDEEQFFRAAIKPVNAIFNTIYDVDVDDRDSWFSRMTLTKSSIDPIAMQGQRSFVIRGEYILDIPVPVHDQSPLPPHIIVDAGRCMILDNGMVEQLKRSLVIPADLERELDSQPDEFKENLNKLLYDIRSLPVLDLYKAIYSTTADDTGARHPLSKRITSLLMLSMKSQVISMGNPSDVRLYENESIAVIIAYPSEPDENNRSVFSGQMIDKKNDTAFCIFGNIDAVNEVDSFFKYIINALFQTNVKAKDGNDQMDSILEH